MTVKYNLLLPVIKIRVIIGGGSSLKAGGQTVDPSRPLLPFPSPFQWRSEDITPRKNLNSRIHVCEF